MRWSKQSKESNTKCFHWLKFIWQRIPNFKNFIFRTNVLSFIAASPSATWRESRTYDFQHNIRAREFPHSNRLTPLLLLQIQSYMWQHYINKTHSFYLSKEFHSCRRICYPDTVLKIPIVPFLDLLNVISESKTKQVLQIWLDLEK